MARFRLRMRNMEINLPMGEIIIGRGPECYLRVDEPMVSRRHARLRVTQTSVTLEDLGSRNGSRVNGINATSIVTLNAGDILGVGTQQFTLDREDEPSPHRPTVTDMPDWASKPGVGTVSVSQSHSDLNHSPVSIASPQTGPFPGGAAFPPAAMTNPGSTISNPAPAASSTSMPGGPMDHPSAPIGEGQTHVASEENSETTGQNRGSAYRLFWGLSDKVLAMGRIEDAERMMGPRLQEMRSRAESGDIPEDLAIIEALRRALRLAGATKKDPWFAWVFDYARLCRYKMPTALLDEVYAQIFACRPAISSRIVAYATTIDDETIAVRLATLRRLCRE
ncbi:MAG TPA: FHA domain-containing protein [Pseudomonadota bacterium]|nr:FHA domain-containing protein [Pseudomonadota bacterium]